MTSAFALATVGCSDKTERPKKGDTVGVEGKIVRLNSWAPGEMVTADGYPATTRDLIIVGPAGSFYHISTTGPNKWSKLEVGNDVYLEGRNTGTCQDYKNMCAQNVEYAKLERTGDKK